jgi:A/G-specific adenine glycosylase
MVMGEWAGLGYYARTRNLLACARAVVADHGGVFPNTEAGLRALPGVGAYTAAAVAAIAFDRVAVVVDGNVERVMARLHAMADELPGARGKLLELAARHTPDLRPGDYAQAVMDLGATICTPRNPACGICPVMGLCEGRAQGIAGELPRKAKKAAKSLRQGKVWVAARSDGALLLEQRPDKGLLGGMPGFPGDGWDGAGSDVPPMQADWIDAGEVRHIFTHIDLRLTVMVARTEGPALRGSFLPADTPLPTLMDKARALALAHQKVIVMMKGGRDDPSPSPD